MWEVKAHLLKQQSSVQPAQVCSSPQAVVAGLAGGNRWHCSHLRQGQAPGGMRELWLVQHNDASDTCYLVDR
jgi:hypothetical protein